jgi:hypothetical protein
MALSNDGGTDLAVTRIEVLSFPYYFAESGQDQYSLGRFDLIPVSKELPLLEPVVYSSDSASGTCTVGSAVLPADGLPVPFIAFAPALAKPDGSRLINGIDLVSDEAYVFHIRLHHPDDSFKDVTVRPRSDNNNFSALEDEFTAIGASCSPR